MKLGKLTKWTVDYVLSVGAKLVGVAQRDGVVYRKYIFDVTPLRHLIDKDWNASFGKDTCSRIIWFSSR